MRRCLVLTLVFMSFLGLNVGQAKETERVKRMRKILTYKVLFFCPKVLKIKTDKDIRAKQKCIIEYLTGAKDDMG